MLVEKMPAHVFLIGLFALLGWLGVTVNLPHFMRVMNSVLLGLSALGLLVILAAWRIPRSYEMQRRWCRILVPLPYAALAIVFGSSFALATIGQGWLRSWGFFLLFVLGVGLYCVGQVVKAGLARRLCSSLGAASVVGGLWLGRVSGDQIFIYLVFCPMIASVCVLLGVLAWRDGGLYWSD